MRRVFFLSMTAIIIGASMISVAMAQRPKEIARLDHFMSNHPQIAKQLAADPKLLDDPRYLDQHQGLKNMLIANPAMHDQIPMVAKRYAEGAPDASKAAESSTPQAQPSAGAKP